MKATCKELLQVEGTGEILLQISSEFKGAKVFIIDLLELMLTNEKLQPLVAENIKKLWKENKAPVAALNLIVEKLDVQDSILYLEKVVDKFDSEEQQDVEQYLKALLKNEGEQLVTIMVTLHRLEKKINVKKVEKAISLMLESTTQYSQAVLGVVVTKLVTEPVLSSLITRTFYLACLTFPELVPTTNQSLATLIRKLWKDELLWGDFCYYSQKLFPATADLLITLTPKMLDTIVNGEMIGKIANYFKENRAMSNNPRYRVLKQYLK